MEAGAIGEMQPSQEDRQIAPVAQSPSCAAYTSASLSQRRSRIVPFRRSPQRHGAWDRKEVLLNPLKISKRFFLTPFLRNCRFFGVSPIVLLCGTGEKEKYPQSKEKLKQRQSDVVERFPPSSPAVPCNAAGHGRGRKGYVRYKQTNMMLFSTPPSLRALPLSHLR